MDMQWITHQAKTGSEATAADGKVAVWPPQVFMIEERRVRRSAFRWGRHAMTGIDVRPGDLTAMVSMMLAQMRRAEARLT